MTSHVCGCPIVASHRKGTERVVCGGSDGRAPDGVYQINRGLRVACPGGREHDVAAEEVVVVRYASRPVDDGTAA